MTALLQKSRSWIVYEGVELDHNYTPTKKRDINEWPYSERRDPEFESVDWYLRMNIAYWIEVSHEDYWHMLGCLPPARKTDAGFVVGEPDTSSDRGNIHSVYIDYESRCFVRLCPKKDWDKSLSSLWLEVMRQVKRTEGAK